MPNTRARTLLERFTRRSAGMCGFKPVTVATAVVARDDDGTVLDAAENSPENRLAPSLALFAWFCGTAIQFILGFWSILGKVGITQFCVFK